MSEILEYTGFGASVMAFTTRRTLGRDRERLCRMLSIDDAHLIMPHQTHGIEVHKADECLISKSADEKKSLLEGIDSVITNMKGVCIGVSTADCIPVLLYDEENKAVAAIHAGWKGTVRRIVQHTISEMTSAYGTRPENLKAVIGPGISLRNFEVGDEVYEKFAEAGFPMERMATRFDKWHLDLWECNRLQLTDLGVHEENIYIEKVCTYDNTDQFFSARREQKGTVKCGRNFNAIMMKPDE